MQRFQEGDIVRVKKDHRLLDGANRSRYEGELKITSIRINDDVSVNVENVFGWTSKWRESSLRLVRRA